MDRPDTAYMGDQNEEYAPRSRGLRATTVM